MIKVHRADWKTRESRTSGYLQVPCSFPQLIWLLLFLTFHFFISGFNIKIFIFVNFCLANVLSACNLLHATPGSQDYGQVIKPCENEQNKQNNSQVQSSCPSFVVGECRGWSDLTGLNGVFGNAALQGVQLISGILVCPCCWLRAAFVGENEFLVLPFVKLGKKIAWD